jgi:Domain of unknown function (DUF4276)
VKVKVYVEGGGDHNKSLQTLCRKGFSEFFGKAGLKGHMPRIVACGGRSRAYDSFRTSHENAGPGEIPVLLVDSEAPVEGGRWEHVMKRSGDGWARPEGNSDDQLHFMVQAMEAWFHADKDALQRFYGQAFKRSALSQRTDIDNIPKADLFTGLRAATRQSQKGEYSKAGHSFQILAQIDPARVLASSPAHAGALLKALERMCLG